MNTGSCIFILYGKLLWHPPQQTWVIHSKLRDQNNKRNCAWTLLRLSIQASHGRREIIRRDERKRSQHNRKERQVSRCSFIISDSAPPVRFQTLFPATSTPSPHRSPQAICTERQEMLLRMQPPWHDVWLPHHSHSGAVAWITDSFQKTKNKKNPAAF